MNQPEPTAVAAAREARCMCRHPQSSHALRPFGDIVHLPHCAECCEVDDDGEYHHDRCFDCAGWRNGVASSGQTYEDQSLSLVTDGPALQVVLS